MKQLSFNEEDIQKDIQALSPVEIQHLADECQMALDIQIEEFENFKQQGFFKRIYNFISGNNTREISKHIRTVADIQKCALIVLNAILRQNKDIMLRISIHEQRILDLAENDNYLQGKINEINQRISEMERNFIFLDIANKLNKTKLPGKKSPYALMFNSVILFYFKVLSSKKISPLSEKLILAAAGIEDMICCILNHVLLNYGELPELTLKELNRYLKKELKCNNIKLSIDGNLPFNIGDFFEQLSFHKYKEYAWLKNPVGLLAYQCFNSNASVSDDIVKEFCYRNEKISIVDYAIDLWYELVCAGRRVYCFDFEEKYNTLLLFSTDKSVSEITQQVLDLADNYKDLFFSRRQDILSSAVYLNQKILTAFLHASKINENYETLLTPEFTLHRGEPQIVKTPVYNKCNAPIEIKPKRILPFLPPVVDDSSLISKLIEARANNFSIVVEQHYPVSELQYNGVAIDCEKAGIHCQEVKSVVAFIGPVVIIKMDPEIEITQYSGNEFCAKRKNEPGKIYEKSLIYYTLPL